jgi:hypothetical protein
MVNPWELGKLVTPGATWLKDTEEGVTSIIAERETFTFMVTVSSAARTKTGKSKLPIKDIIIDNFVFISSILMFIKYGI